MTKRTDGEVHHIENVVADLEGDGNVDEDVEREVYEGSDPEKG
jgi:hypothetical protein